MEKLSLDFAKSKGCVVESGDLIVDPLGCDVRTSETNLSFWNRREDFGGGWFITSFADRENKGEQPVPDYFPVVVYFKNGHDYKDRAAAYDWNKSMSCIPVSKWKPDYEALLKMQKLHDRDQPKVFKTELRDYKIRTIKDVIEEQRYELKSNVEYYSPVTGYVYKLSGNDLQFFSGEGVWFKSGVQSAKALQLRDRVKPVVIWYALVMKSGTLAGYMQKKDIHHFLSLTTNFETIKRINGKPVLRPIYKKD